MMTVLPVVHKHEFFVIIQLHIDSDDKHQNIILFTVQSYSMSITIITFFFFC
jgi:hypothetical protein